MPKILIEESGQRLSGQKLLTVKEAAKILHAHPSSVRRWAALGLLSGVRVAPRGHLNFHASDIDRFLQSGQRTAQPTTAVHTGLLQIWSSPRIKAILERPEGSPIDLSGLTEEERGTLVESAKGMWADHTEITDSVQWVRTFREGWPGSSPDQV